MYTLIKFANGHPAEITVIDKSTAQAFVDGADMSQRGNTTSGWELVAGALAKLDPVKFVVE